MTVDGNGHNAQFLAGGCGVTLLLEAGIRLHGADLNAIVAGNGHSIQFLVGGCGVVTLMQKIGIPI